MYITAAAPLFVNCIFLANEGYAFGTIYDGKSARVMVAESPVELGGGAAFIVNAWPGFYNCRFLGNLGYRGGALYLVADGSQDPGKATLGNCEFSGNYSMHEGGAVYATGNPQLDVRNCTVVGNGAGAAVRGEASLGGGLFLGGATAAIYNSILWANFDGGASLEEAQIKTFNYGSATVRYSCIDGLSLYSKDPGTSAPIRSSSTTSATTERPAHSTTTCASSESRAWDAGDNDETPVDAPTSFTTRHDGEIPFESRLASAIEVPFIQDTAPRRRRAVVDMGAHEPSSRATAGGRYAGCCCVMQ